MIVEKNYMLYGLKYPFKSWRNKYFKKFFKNQAKQNGLFDLAVEDLMQYTNQSREQVLDIYKAGQQDVIVSTFSDDKQKKLTQEEVEDFYRQYSFYIYELPLWNAETGRPQMLVEIMKPYLEKFNCKTVLDIGGGTGDLCMEFYKQGYQPVYFDISDESTSFSAWRFNKNKYNINQYNNFSQLEQPFDCVVTFDVLEHIKNMDEFIGHAVKYIKAGGLFIFSGAFMGGLLHLRENEQYADINVLNEACKKHGLKFLDKFAQNFIYSKES